MPIVLLVVLLVLFATALGTFCFALTRAFGGQLFGVDQQKRFLLFQAA